jgi:hypothetical protein
MAFTPVRVVSAMERAYRRDPSGPLVMQRMIAVGFHERLVRLGKRLHFDPAHPDHIGTAISVVPV